MTGATGLRQRKKLATRQAISWAAVRLAVEHGPENVRLEDIAAGAGVSPRTCNNYFSSKEAAVCGFVVARGESIRDALLARPREEPLVEALVAAVLAQFGSPEPDRESVVRTRLVVSSPVLQGEYLKAMAVTERYVAEAIALRTGTRAETDLRSRVIAAVAATAVRVGVEQWVASGTGRFSRVIGETLRLALAGFAVPQVHSSTPRRRRT